MLLTKHAAELCALVVNDLHGELPSRILAALLRKGRSNINELTGHTALSALHVRHALGVLIQYNLLYHSSLPNSAGTTYEANPDACYNLMRSGKIMHVIEQRFGKAERDFVHIVMYQGHARIGDLAAALPSRVPDSNGYTNDGGHTKVTHPQSQSSEMSFDAILSRLVQAEIIEQVRPESFRNPRDILENISRSVRDTGPGEKPSRNKVEQQHSIQDKFSAYRKQKLALKDLLTLHETNAAKRRKLDNGFMANNQSQPVNEPLFDPDTIIRLNHEKCLVDLRNQRLREFVAENLGEVTAEIYGVVLDLVTTNCSSCRHDSLIGEDSSESLPPVSTVDIFDRLDESVAVHVGIGKAGRDKIHTPSAELIQKLPPEQEEGFENTSDVASIPIAPASRLNGFHAGDDSGSNGIEQDTSTRVQTPRVNGKQAARVTFEDQGDAVTSRLLSMRQHLLLLAESKFAFIRHCGTHGHGQWTIDFPTLMSQMRETELDAVIEQSFGRHGLRLTRVLREKGKLDEKMLPSAALMKKSDVQGKMLAMQMAGIVDVQEVPKDSSRLANRTLFFWYFDAERTQTQLLDDIYKAMLRCFQALQMERYRKKNVLSFVERKDVQGRAEEVMTADHYNELNQHLEIQEKLLGQVGRLDDLVAVIRDY